jgi:AraC-like DNA-binding protein
MSENLQPFYWPMRTWTQLLCAGRYPLSDRNYQTIYHSRTHALHLYEYHATLRVGTQHIAIAPGDVTISPAGGEAAYDLPRPGHHYCIHFYPVALAGQTVTLPLHLTLGAAGRWVIDRIRLASRYVQLRQHAGDLADTRASLVLQDILLWLADAAARRDQPCDARSLQAVEHLADWLNHRFAQAFTLAEVAERAKLSPNYLAKVFRRRFGTTIAQYILDRRMEHAAHLLTDTDMPIGQIGKRVGIADPQYFNKLFRRNAGVSPSAFRQRRPRTS